MANLTPPFDNLNNAIDYLVENEVISSSLRDRLDELNQLSLKVDRSELYEIFDRLDSLEKLTRLLDVRTGLTDQYAIDMLDQAETYARLTKAKT